MLCRADHGAWVDGKNLRGVGKPPPYNFSRMLTEEGWALSVGSLPPLLRAPKVPTEGQEHSVITGPPPHPAQCLVGSKPETAR